MQGIFLHSTKAAAMLPKNDINGVCINRKIPVFSIRKKPGVFSSIRTLSSAELIYNDRHRRTGRDVRDVRVRPWCRTKDGVGLSLP